MNEPQRRSAGVAQYLTRHASPEIAIAESFRDQYRSVLVIPAFREARGMLAQYRLALDGAPGRVLVIVVVNAAAPHAVSTWPTHRDLLGDLQGKNPEQLSSAPRSWLARHAGWDVLSVDRAHPDSCLPERQGVGLARKIGCDLALALHAAGRLEFPYFYCTDADAELPANYFEEPPATAGTAPSAIVFPFWHVPGGDAAIDAATALYELGLRYYVVGLAHAGSPFAFHAIGSAMAVEAGAYAAVRGFPKRLAGEDFYLLDKLAKVAPVLRDANRTVLLRSRASTRTAHGTGVAAVKLAAQRDPEATTFYHPQAFALLRYWLQTIETFAETADLSTARSQLLNAAGPLGPDLDDVLTGLGAWHALASATEQVHGHARLRRRLHTWFDGFRTLKLVHALRQRALPSIPFREALGAPWLSTSSHAAHAAVDPLRRLLADQSARFEATAGLGSVP